MVYQCEKTLNDLGDKISADEKKGIEDEIAKVKEALKGTDVNAIKTANDELNVTDWQDFSCEVSIAEEDLIGENEMKIQFDSNDTTDISFKNLKDFIFFLIILSLLAFLKTTNS